jgi:hypothetical protein
MTNSMKNRSLRIGAVLAIGVMACQELEVTNPNKPDRERATQQPTSVESFVSTSFRSFYPTSGHGTYPSWALSTMADETTSGFADFGQLEVSALPRSAWNNSPVSARRNVNENPWYGMYRTISSVNDALIAIDSGLVVNNDAGTARAKAVGKFIQGISHAHLAFYFDSALVVDEHVSLASVTNPQFVSYNEVAKAAVAQLDSAIAVATRGPSFTLPPDGWLFQAMSRDQFIRLANSYAARTLAYTPRTRAERNAVDWAEVIRRVDVGIQTDFAPVAGDSSILRDDWKRLVARVRGATLPPSDYGRPSYGVLGPADSTQGYVSYLSTPLNNRAAFQITTKDRRIHSAAGPATPGKYVGYNLRNIGDITRGSWRYSHYYFLRYGTGVSNMNWYTAPQSAVTVTEMNLLKAEALIRLNRAGEALPLINATRVANGQLPPVTVDGPPDEPGCVPRKLSGACGSLWDALRYEKRIEGLGVDGVTAFFDARGWQTLPADSFVQLPIPGRELAVLVRPLYTYGGPGGQSSAPTPDPERCPVALARCP